MGDSFNPMRIIDPIGIFGGNSSGKTGNKKGGITSWGDNRDDLKELSVNAAEKYMDRVNTANNGLRNNVNKLAGNYSSDITNANNTYNNKVNRATSKYENTVNPLVGEKGYQKGLGLAQKGAVDSANQAAATSAGAARNNGMNKNASIVYGANNTINAYNQGLANQQTQVQNNFNNAINSAGNVYGTETTAAGNVYGTDVAGANNRFSTLSNMENQYASNAINSAGQDVANKTNIFNAAYNNQDVIEKLLSGFGSGLGNLPGLNLFGGK